MREWLVLGETWYGWTRTHSLRVSVSVRSDWRLLGLMWVSWRVYVWLGATVIQLQSSKLWINKSYNCAFVFTYFYRATLALHTRIQAAQLLAHYLSLAGSRMYSLARLCMSTFVFDLDKLFIVIFVFLLYISVHRFGVDAMCIFRWFWQRHSFVIYGPTKRKKKRTNIQIGRYSR